MQNSRDLGKFTSRKELCKGIVTLSKIFPTWVGVFDINKYQTGVRLVKPAQL